MYRRVKSILGASFVGLALWVGSQNQTVAIPKEAGICWSDPTPISIKRVQTPKKLYLKTSNGVYIVSDRQESFAESFKRRRIMAANVIATSLPETFASAAVEQNDCFVSHPSFNDDGSGKVELYGLFFRLAPVSTQILRFWKQHPQMQMGWTTILLERDPRDSELYYFVGWVTDEAFSFDIEESRGDSLNRRSLWYQGKDAEVTPNFGTL